MGVESRRERLRRRTSAGNWPLYSHRAPQVSAGDSDTMVHLAHLLLKNYHGGHVVIRFARGGCANRPYFRIVAAYNKRARDSKYLEQVGCYDPLPNSQNEKLVGLNIERLKHWIGCGANITKPVGKLLGLSGFFPLHPMTITNAERFRKRRALEAVTVSEEDISDN